MILLKALQKIRRSVKLHVVNIDDAYFIKNPNSKTNKQSKQTVVVKFSSKKSKEILMGVKPKLKEMKLIMLKH